jgi:hypothetical protein
MLLAGAAALYAGFWLVGRLRSLLVLLLISFFLAFAIEPRPASRPWCRRTCTATT